MWLAPELARVRHLAEASELSEAARELRTVLEKAAKDGTAPPGWWYWLGVLEEQIPDWPRAREAYGEAARQKWPLSNHARLGMVRALLKLRQAELALAALNGVAAEEVLLVVGHGLRGDALMLLSQYAQAVVEYRRALDGASSEFDSAGLRLKLVGAILAQVTASSAPAEQTKLSLIRDGLGHCREIQGDAGVAPEQARKAAELEKRLVAGLDEALRRELGEPSSEQLLDRAEAALSSRDLERATEAIREYDEGLAKTSSKRQSQACRAGLVKAKLLVARGGHREAAESYQTLARTCKDSDDLAKVLYLAGAELVRIGKPVAAIERYEELERRIPDHRLADDARLKRAMALLDIHAEAQFTKLLGRMIDDYPTGDMVCEGVFQLALRRILRGDWSGAGSLLERLRGLAEKKGSLACDHEREDYFLARVQRELGQREKSLEGYERVIEARPFSYYMIMANSRLMEQDPARADRLRERLEAEAKNLQLPKQQELDHVSPGLERVLELLSVGDTNFARMELSAVAKNQEKIGPSLLFALAALYEDAGASHRGLALLKSMRDHDPMRWPQGDWRGSWETAYPRPYARLVAREATRQELPESLIYAIMREESAFDPDVRSRVGALGLMQLMPPTARDAAKSLSMAFDAKALTRPAVNIPLGSRVLSDLMKRFDRQVIWVAAAYNAGPTRLRRWLRDRPDMDLDVWVESIPYEETRRYAKRVVSSQIIYAWLYEGQKAESLLIPRRISPTP